MYTWKSDSYSITIYVLGTGLHENRFPTCTDIQLSSLECYVGGNCHIEGYEGDK